MINLSLFFVSDLEIFNRFTMSSDSSFGLWIRTNPFFLQAILGRKRVILARPTIEM